MTKVPHTLIVLCLLALFGLGGYYIGKEEGMQTGAKQAKETAQNEINNLNEISQRSNESYIALKGDYDDLASQYDTLYTTVKNYVNTANYRAPSSFTCTTTPLGYSTTTRCY